MENTNITKNNEIKKNPNVILINDDNYIPSAPLTPLNNENPPEYSQFDDDLDRFRLSTFLTDFDNIIEFNNLYANLNALIHESHSNGIVSGPFHKVYKIDIEFCKELYYNIKLFNTKNNEMMKLRDILTNSALIILNKSEKENKIKYEIK
jgi:hypothetical protein